MALSPVDIITEVMADLEVACDLVGSEYEYVREGDKIVVKGYNEDGTLTEVMGHLKFEEA